MSDVTPEIESLDHAIDLARKRITDLEALAVDDSPHGASPRVVRALVAEWQNRLREMQRRREALLRLNSAPSW